MTRYFLIGSSSHRTRMYNAKDNGGTLSRELRPNTAYFGPFAQYFDLLRSKSIAGQARCNRSCSASRCRSAQVAGSGPQMLSKIASLIDVTGYPIRSMIHNQNRGNTL